MSTTYTEQTFKDSTFTVYQETACHGPLTPYNYIFIQAPRGVADDIMRKNVCDPNELTCEEHESTAYSVSEDCTLADYASMFDGKSAPGMITALIMRYDYVAYYANGTWKLPMWFNVERKR